MEQDTPYLLTRYALTRLLKEFALELGMGDTMADVTAQVHVQQSTLPDRWVAFFMNNCVSCEKNPETCEVMDPKPENCRGNATPQTVRTAAALAIENGNMKGCPAHVPRNRA